VGICHRRGCALSGERMLLPAEGVGLVTGFDAGGVAVVAERTDETTRLSLTKSTVDIPGRRRIGGGMGRQVGIPVQQVEQPTTGQAAGRLSHPIILDKGHRPFFIHKSYTVVSEGEGPRSGMYMTEFMPGMDTTTELPVLKLVEEAKDKKRLTVAGDNTVSTR